MIVVEVFVAVILGAIAFISIVHFVVVPWADKHEQGDS